MIEMEKDLLLTGAATIRNLAAKVDALLELLIAMLTVDQGLMERMDAAVRIAESEEEHDRAQWPMDLTVIIFMLSGDPVKMEQFKLALKEARQRIADANEG